MLATANTGKIGRGFRKNAGEWTGRVEISKEELPVSVAYMVMKEVEFSNYYNYIYCYRRSA